MSDRLANITRSSRSGGILAVAAAIAGFATLLHMLAGAALALAVGGFLGAAFLVTLATQRDRGGSTCDPVTGLPDRAAVIRNLEGMLAQSRPSSRQGAVLVIGIEAAGTAPLDHPTLMTSVLRLTQILRKGDQIARIGPEEIAVLLEPARGLGAASLQGIASRIAGPFSEPLSVGGRMVQPIVAVGGCAERDAPEPTGRSWLEAARQAARLARDAGTPVIFEWGLVPPLADAEADSAQPAPSRRRSA